MLPLAKLLAGPLLSEQGLHTSDIFSMQMFIVPPSVAVNFTNHQPDDTFFMSLDYSPLF
jgi:hypothetical protein